MVELASGDGNRETQAKTRLESGSLSGHSAPGS